MFFYKFAILFATLVLNFCSIAVAAGLQEFGQNGGVLCDNHEWFSDYSDSAEIVSDRNFITLVFSSEISHKKPSQLKFRIDHGNVGAGYGVYMAEYTDGSYKPFYSSRVAWFVDLAGAGSWNLVELNLEKEVIGNIKLSCDDAWELKWWRYNKK